MAQTLSQLGKSTAFDPEAAGTNPRQPIDFGKAATTTLSNLLTGGVPIGAVKDPSAAEFSSSLRYPSDPGIDANTDYVMFDFYKYEPPFSKTGNEGSLFDPLKNYNSSVTQYAKSTKNLKQIMLYMPEDVSTGYKSNWLGKGFNTDAGAIMRTMGAENIIAGGGEAVKGAAGAVDLAQQRIMAKSVTDKIMELTGDSVTADDYFGGQRGVIFNPNTELLFQGFDLRNFTLKFKLVPRTVNEANNIEAILLVFKRAMLPSMSTGQELTTTLGAAGGLFGVGGGLAIGGEAAWKQAFIAVPDLCKVQFMTGSNVNTHVPQFKMCAITQVDINYTPDGVYATTSDKRMVAYELTINFQETKLIFSEEVANY